MKETPRIILKPGREVSLLRHHPWLFSGGIARAEGDPEPGSLVAVYDASNAFRAWGHYSPESQIRVRLISWDEEETPDTPAFWEARLRRALEARAVLFHDRSTNAFRLINAESDGIPGLIVDRYADALVLQSLTVGIEARKELLAELLMTRLLPPDWSRSFKPHTLYERSDADIRGKEGLKSRIGLLGGQEPDDTIEILENGLRFLVDIRGGQKSGFYLDQRENRQHLREAIQGTTKTGKAPTLLNVFAYTGGFAIYGLAGGAGATVNVDASAEALLLGRRNLSLNALGENATEDIADDAFKVLRQMRQECRLFDCIVLDPPKFAFTEKDVQRASKGYKDINLQALHLLPVGGLLFTFSCSGAITADLFQKIIFGAALDAGREVQIIGWMTQSGDHPVALTFPEGAYLKGLICRVVK